MDIELRRTTEHDLPYVLSAEGDDDSRRFIAVWPEEKHHAALDDTNIEHLIIESKPNSRPIGFVILAGLQGEHRSVEFMRIVVTDKGKGYGRAAVRAIMRHAFETLSAHRLWLDVKEHNTRARAVYEKEGFRYEGMLRECLRGPEGFESLVVMSVLEQEYRGLTTGSTRTLAALAPVNRGVGAVEKPAHSAAPARSVRPRDRPGRTLPMPRFKPVHKGLKLLPVDFDKQVQPGSFEHALCYLVDHELDLTERRGCYRNDGEGASAYDPAVLLKIVLLAYSRGIVGSREIEVACRENVLFIAVSGDSQPHFTTLADFISRLGEAVARLFAQVLTVCERQGLIGREMFAIDGVQLPSNAAKAKSGTREDYRRELGKMEEVARKMLATHRDADAGGEAPPEREAKKLERLQREASKLKAWLAAHPEDKKSAKGRVRLSNRTDNESAKRATAKGVIQGYTGVAAVDEKHQSVVEAQAHGTGSEQELLVPVVEATGRLRTPATRITADAGYHSEDNLIGRQSEGAGRKSG